MKYLPLPEHLFIENRKRLAALLRPRSVAILNANDIMPTNADGTMPFRQNNDLFYLSGIDQEETVLVLFPDAPKQEWKEMLFLRQTNEHIQVWEGHKLSKHQAAQQSGIANVYWLSDLPVLLPQIVFEAEYIYLNSNEHSRSTNQVPTRDTRFIQEIKNQYPLHKLERLAPLMHELRAVKSHTEVQIIQKAIDITAKAFERVLHFVRPGVYEFEIEAEIIHEFIRNRATGHAYHPIIASGKDSCILHYNQNNKICSNGEVLLLDFGAEYANYAADLTRTIPVSGQFTPRQAQVYNAVLHMQNQAKKFLKKGVLLDDYHKQMGEVATEELIKLGLLAADEVKNQNPDKPLYKKYFMHGVSHFLGLDVHDVGYKYKALQPGMVLTCEPGIYIPDEGIGIRLENDILITNEGNTDLMEHIPISLADIEGLMVRK